MDMNNRNTRLTCSTRSNLADALEDLNRVINTTMDKSPSYDTALQHKFARVDLNTAVAFYDRVPAAIDVKKCQESQAAGTKTLKDEERVRKAEPSAGQSPRDLRCKIAAVLANISVVTKVEVTEIIEFCIAKINDKIETGAVESVADTFEDGLQSGYPGSNEELKLVMLKILKYSMTEDFSTDRGYVFAKFQLARFMQSEKTIEKIVKSVLSSTTFIEKTAEIV